jgi:hypothetical protein
MKCKCCRRQYKTGKIVPVKEVGASCIYKNSCTNRLKDSPESIFHTFWDLPDFNSQNGYVYLTSNIKMQRIKRR